MGEALTSNRVCRCLVTWQIPFLTCCLPLWMVKPFQNGASFFLKKKKKKKKSLTAKKQTTKFSSANFQKMLSPSHITLRIQRLKSK